MRTVAMYAPSKTFNLAGLVASYHIVYNSRIRDQLNKETAISRYNEMNVLSMHALTDAYGEVGEEWLGELLQVLDGNGARCVLMAVYGNRAIDDTLVQMEDTANAKGFRVIAGISAVAQHSILPQYATGRPDAQDAVQLKGFSVKILEKATSNDCGKPKIPGNRPYKKPGSGMAPKAGSACTACGLCAQKCPMGAIDVQNPKLTDKSKCIGCMRCVSVCPTHARSISKVMAGVAAIALKKSCSDRKENVLYI